MDQFPPPAYSEKVSDVFTTQRSTLAQSLSLARSKRIEETINTSIYPYLETAVSRGLSKTTLVLLPADITSSLDVDSKETAASASVIGFSSDEHVQLIYLSQDAGNLDFWRQNNVIPDLVSSLKATLHAAGSNVRSSENVAMSPMESMASPPPLKSNRSWFKRTASKPKLDVSGVDAGISQSLQKGLSPGEIDVTAAIQDVNFRVVTPMGLYETRSDRGVVVKMEVGT